jgi:hypothetical protein
MGVSDNFSKLCSNLYVDNQASISTRYKQITKRLNIDFWGSDSELANSRYVGSYGRDTAIRKFHDLDILFCLPVKYYNHYNSYSSNGQSALLQAVKTSLQKTYPSTAISGDGQVVVIRFTDEMRFEIVPAFTNNDNSYTYADSNDGGKWRITNPLPEIAAIQSGDNNWNKNLKRLCRMTRAWKRKHDVPMGGLLIDTLAYNFLKDWSFRDKSFLFYDFMMRDFFLYMSSLNRDQTYWLAVGSNQYVWRKGIFEAKAKQAYNLSLEAITHESNNQLYSAAAKWREIFGTFYPNYAVS